MRLLFLVLTLLTLMLQYPLWWGKDGWLRVHELQDMQIEHEQTNQALMARNAALQAEVQDLRSGTQAQEERARGEMGMLKEGEIFVQFLDKDEPEPQLRPATASSRPGGR